MSGIEIAGLALALPPLIQSVGSSMSSINSFHTRVKQQPAWLQTWNDLFEAYVDTASYVSKTLDESGTLLEGEDQSMVARQLKTLVDVLRRIDESLVELNSMKPTSIIGKMRRQWKSDAATPALTDLNTVIGAYLRNIDLVIQLALK
jgi:hypothetical protein